MPRGLPSPARRAVAILNQKGGVGKTTVTLGLASAALAAGRRALVVDLDPQASSTWVLGHLAGGDRGDDLAPDAPPAVALVDAPGLGQLLDRLRLALGDAEDGQVGQHLAHRRVVGRGLPFAPRGHRLGDGARPRPQRAGILQLRPGHLGVDGAGRPGAQLLSLIHI